MRPTLHLLHLSRLLLLTTTATAFFNSGPARQAPLSNPIEPHPFPSLASPLLHLIARCPLDTHWACFYHHRVYCLCSGNRRDDSHLASSETHSEDSHEQPRAQAPAQEKNITSLDILAEVQPGNNDTLVSLITVQCPPWTRVGCHWVIPCRFACGCIPRVFEFATAADDDDDEGAIVDDAGSEGEGREYLKTHDEMPGLEDPYRAEEEHDGKGEDDVRKAVASSAEDFRFERVRWPRCNKVGYHLKCCPVGRKSVCFCGSGTGCPRE